MKKMQRVQNYAAKLIDSNKSTPMSEMFYKLHWLQMNERIIFKLLLLAQKSVYAISPVYLRDLFVMNNKRTCNLDVIYRPSTAHGKRAIASCIPKLWNALPTDMKNIHSTQMFKNKLKTYFFKNLYEYKQMIDQT